MGPLGFTITGENLTPLTSGKKTSTTVGTAVKLVSGETACALVVIQALSNNAKNIVAGDSSVVASTLQGLELEPGQIMAMSLRNANTCYIDVNQSGDGAAYVLFG